MKAYFALLAVAFWMPLADLYAQQCTDPIPGSYTRKLPNSYYTWRFDASSLVETLYNNNVSDPVTEADMRNYASEAARKWTEAANQEGTRITLEESTGGTSDILIGFTLMEDCGDFDALNKRIRLKRWTNWTRGGLETTVLHEMGHLFLGTGHHGAGVMGPYIGNDGTCTRTQYTLGDCESQWTLDRYNPKITFNVKNVFGDESGGGAMFVGGQEITLVSTGYTQVTRRTSQFPITLQAKTGQTSGGFPQNFTAWTGDQSGSTLPITINGAGAYAANFRDVYTVTVRTSGPTGVFPGKVRINNGPELTSPTTLQVQQDNPLLVEAIVYHTHNHIGYTFASWTPFGYTSQPATYYAARTSYTFTANFTARPLPAPNMQVGGAVGENVRVTWSEHPNPDVTEYHIWRKTKTTSASRVALRNRGTLSWTDPTYRVSGSSSSETVFYDVKAYYAPNGSTSEDRWVTIWGETEPLVRAGDRSGFTVALELPGSFSIGAYPNPFNPSTTIRFDLPEKSFVRLRVFDMLGRQVALLVEEEKSAGSHAVTFNASNLPSGIYFYRIEAGNFIETKRVVLMK